MSHTDDLERRIGQHHQGAIPGYTFDRRPVECVWSEAFGTRDEAREAERRLKGWGQAKKLALIRRDWSEIQRLARSKRASTSSAKSVVVKNGSATLHPHFDHLPSQDYALEVEYWYAENRLRLVYRLSGEIEAIAVPEAEPQARCDGLWAHTCFEVFIRPDEGSSYEEYNVSPSTLWAAYAFGAYRSGMCNLDVEAPALRIVREQFALKVDVSFAYSETTASRLGLAAVIEEIDGTKSYWALRHPPGAPDFHHLDCFALTLPAPDAA